MINDRRTFLDGSTAPRKPLPAPLTEGAMKAAMEDWLTALPKPAVKEFFGVAKKFFNPKDKKKADAKNLEILKKYKIKPLINDPSHRESLNALSCCLDMLMGGQGEMPWESVEIEGDSIEEVTTEAKMIKYPADLQYKKHRDMTPAEKQRWIAYNRAYNQAVSSRDYSGIETRPSLGTKSKEYQDAWKVWNNQRIKHGANRDFHLIKPFVAPKEKTKKEEVTTEAKNYAKMSDKSIVTAEMQTILSLAMQTLQGAMGEQDMTDVRYTKRVGIEINSERHEQLMLALEREVKKGGSKLQMWGRKKGQGVG